jgi:hypothetical protein
LIEHIEGEIIFRISKHLGIEPTEVIKRKRMRDINIRFLWRRYYLEIKADNEEMEKIKKQNNER